MKKPATFLNSFRLSNFKAIQDSKSVKLTPLTVFIGNNGSGKSSFIEGMETYRQIVTDGLDAGMERWFGMQHVWNKAVRHQLGPLGLQENPISFGISTKIEKASCRFDMKVNAKPGMNGIFIQEENIIQPGNRVIHRASNGSVATISDGVTSSWERKVSSGKSVLPQKLKSVISGWQFLALMPNHMGGPYPKKMTANGNLNLNTDGSNLAQYLLMIRDKDTTVFNDIVETMKCVLDYAENFEPFETQEIQRTMLVQMLEKDFSIPGWMLSTGTIRILALLAVLRNPDPPPLVVIEEIENGLDPRTIDLVLAEIREAVQSGTTQVIVTTHSPYFLDLVPLETLVLVDRKKGGNPAFVRPAGDDDVKEWAKDFTPGKLYTMGQLDQAVKS